MNKPENHEITEWRARPFLIGLGCFLAFVIVMDLAIGALASDWSHGFWPQHQPPTSPESTVAWNNEAPQLQTDAAQDLAKVRKIAQAHLQATRWNDAAHTDATIPIDRAMALLARADAGHQAVLPPPVPATPIELQDQKSSTLAPPATQALANPSP